MLAALAVENRALHIRSDSKYAVDFFNQLIKGTPLPHDGEHIDLWKQVKELLDLRIAPVRVSWVKSHVTQEQVNQGFFTQQDKDGNDAADRAAMLGAAMHAVPESVVKSYHDYSQHMKQVALMCMSALLVQEIIVLSK